MKKDLESAQEDLKEFRERNRQVQYSPALLLEEERLTTEMDVKKEIFSTLKQQFELAKIEEVEEGLLKIFQIIRRLWGTQQKI